MDQGVDPLKLQQWKEHLNRPYRIENPIPYIDIAFYGDCREVTDNFVEIPIIPSRVEKVFHYPYRCPFQGEDCWRNAYPMVAEGHVLHLGVFRHCDISPNAWDWKDGIYFSLVFWCKKYREQGDAFLEYGALHEGTCHRPGLWFKFTTQVITATETVCTRHYIAKEEWNYPGLLAFNIHMAHAFEDLYPDVTVW